MRNAPPIGQFFERSRDSALHGTLFVAPSPQPIRLHLWGRRLKQQHESAVGVTLEYLARSLYLDHQYEVTVPIGRIGHRRAVQVSEILGPLKEGVVVEVALKRVAVNKYVRVRFLARTGRTRRPRTRQDETIVPGAEKFGDGVFSDPAGAGDDDDQSFG